MSLDLGFLVGIGLREARMKGMLRYFLYLEVIGIPLNAHSLSGAYVPLGRDSSQFSTWVFLSRS